MHTTHTTHRVRVWDLPTRLFHIALILAVAGLYITSEIEGDAMQIHFWLGYTVLALVLFRLAWGLVGGHWSRFVNFVPTPAKFFAYVQALRSRSAASYVGHNPLGALSVLTMLVVLLLQVFSGFMSDDDISNAGPWAQLVPSHWVELAPEYHSEIGQVLLIILMGLHVATVLYYKFIKQDDLITPMVKGDKNLQTEAHASRDTWTSRIFALSIFAACCYAVFRLVTMG